MQSFNTDISISEKYNAVSEVLTLPKSKNKIDSIRVCICNQIQTLLNNYAKHKDKTALRRKCQLSGYELSKTNFDRIQGLPELNILVSERTSFIVLKHAVEFFEIPQDEAEHILSIVYDAII